MNSNYATLSVVAILFAVGDLPVGATVTLQSQFPKPISRQFSWRLSLTPDGLVRRSPPNSSSISALCEVKDIESVTLAEWCPPNSRAFAEGCCCEQLYQENSARFSWDRKL